jgi:hypothetical protein
MEIRESQRTSTQVQATTHNMFTVTNDLAMFECLARKRGLPEGFVIDVGMIRTEQAALAERMLRLYEFALSREVGDHADDIGHERTREEVIHRDRIDARQFETRREGNQADTGA